MEGRSCYSTTDTLTAAISQSDMLHRQGYHTFPGGVVKEGYVDTYSYWKKRGLDWLETNDSAEDYPPASHLFQMETTGFANNALSYRAEVTYYVQFKVIKGFGQ